MLRAMTAFVIALAVRQANPALLISTVDLARQLGDPALVILHVSERESTFTDAHIPGARFVHYEDIAVDDDAGPGTELPDALALKRVFERAGVSDNSRVVIYGSSTTLAARAFFTLDIVGHDHVALLDGGLVAWQAESRPVESGAGRAANAGSFHPRINAARIANAAFIQQQLGANAITLLDIRPDAEYLGTDGGMRGRYAPGHIDGAYQLPWNTLVGSDGRFLSREELEIKLRAAGVTSARPVVSYCMVGMRASVAYFVARYLGYDARLYDGSMVDWSRRNLPLKTGK
jgi:thiosulfate/3-mercaptopyruvate sulfurtransferase